MCGHNLKKVFDPFNCQYDFYYGTLFDCLSEFLEDINREYDKKTEVDFTILCSDRYYDEYSKRMKHKSPIKRTDEREKTMGDHKKVRRDN